MTGLFRFTRAIQGHPKKKKTFQIPFSASFNTPCNIFAYMEKCANSVKKENNKYLKCVKILTNKIQVRILKFSISIYVSSISTEIAKKQSPLKRQ